MTRIDWGGTDRRVRNRMAQYGDAVKQGIFNLGQDWSPRLESYAKQQAPWTDRTGNARQGLWSRAFAVHDGNTVVIVLSHAVYYGVFLELAHAGRYAIIGPTLEAHYQQVWNSYQQMVGAR